MKYLDYGWKLLRYTVELYERTGCRQSAAALTYMTLFAIVPMMTVTYSMFSVIPAFQGLGEQLQELIFAHFIPASGRELGTYLKEFSDQARSLTAAGVAMLVVTAYLMLKNIEQVFNTVWGVKDGRNGLSNFLLYWAVLSLGPILLGAGVATSTYILSLRLLLDEHDVLGIGATIFSFFPGLLAATGFTLLFAAVPNCRVPLKHAILGGVVTAICFELLKTLFAMIVARSAFQVIYGAFAFVPLFLMWIYLMWMVVLAGAVLVRGLSTWHLRHGQPLSDLQAALVILWLLHQRQASGGTLSDHAICGDGIGDGQWRQLRDLLLQHRLIALSSKGRYLLSRDLHSVTLQQLVGWTGQAPVRISDDTATYPWLPLLAARLDGIREYTGEQLGLSLAELFAVNNVADAQASNPASAATDTDAEALAANAPPVDRQGRTEFSATELPAK